MAIARIARRFLGVSTVLAMASWQARASALSEPDGTVIPITSQLQDVFNAAQDPIDALADAADVPETFNPSCNLTFTLVSRGGASFKNIFGWYNVTGSLP